MHRCLWHVTCTGRIGSAAHFFSLILAGGVDASRTRYRADSELPARCPAAQSPYQARRSSAQGCSRSGSRNDFPIQFFPNALNCWDRSSEDVRWQSTRKTPLDGRPDLPRDARLALPLHPFPGHRGRLPSSDCLFVYRIQMQSRLPLLLGLRQQSQRDDRRYGQTIHRLASRHRLPGAGLHGRRTTLAAGPDPAHHLLRGQEGLLDLSSDQCPPAAHRRHR